MPKILVDGRFIGIGESIARYTLETLSRILEIDKENQYSLLIRPQGVKTLGEFFKSEILNPKSETNSNNQNINSQNIPANLKIVVKDFPHYSVAEQKEFLSWLNHKKYDLVHFTQFNHPILYKGKFVSTIHDLTMIGHLHRQKFWRRWACLLTMRSAILNSQKVFAVSGFTKQDLVDWYGVDPGKIIVTYNGINHQTFNIGVQKEKAKIEEFKKKYDISGDYFLYTGAWKKHKNLLRLLESYEIFSKQKKENRIQLVLVGKIDDKEPEVTAEIDRINKILNTRYSIPNSIVTTGFIGDTELPTAYAGASAYIIPSLSEGFGFPPLEAMACGTPVISSKESCMPEVLGDAAYYFDPYDVKDMAKAMSKITLDEELRQSLITKGIAQSDKYDWHNTARQTLVTYKEVLKR